MPSASRSRLLTTVVTTVATAILYGSHVSSAYPATAGTGTPDIQARFLSGPEELRASYDYVIIGGGTAGLTVADRLTEDAETTVLVIENGGSSNSTFVTWARNRVSWTTEEPWTVYNVTIAPNEQLEGAKKQFGLPAGNLVGGSSAINGMQSVRATSDDYDRWGSFFGNESEWSWEGMFPYFQKAIHYQPPVEMAVQQMPGMKFDTSYWGNSSRLYSGFPTFQWPGIHYQWEAYASLPGVEVPVDSGAGKPGVYWYPQLMDAYGSINRSYARTGHYDGLNRANYDLITWSHVSKILLDENNRATGASFRPFGTEPGTEETTVVADKEVILSAGSLHSPQILQLSGIGPRALLESAGIAVKVEVPGVGQNFQDHNCLHTLIEFQNFTTRPNWSDDMVAEDPDFIAWAEMLWETNRTGPYSTGMWHSAAWLPLSVATPDGFESLAAKVDASIETAGDYLPADTHPTVIAGYQARLGALAGGMRSNNTIWYMHNFWGDRRTLDYFVLEHPLSQGHVNINVTAPEAEPIVDYRTYSNPVDFDVMLALARFHRATNLESPALQEIAPVELSPGLEVTSDEDWIAYMRENTDPTAIHPSGTCAMMPLELGGVVDEELRVYGVEGLRVVDASVMPVIVASNICQPVYAIAEKAADIIKRAAAST
ncbi:hypothetical protein F4778DRAFT_6488 [Xylariomycetidae sp. FL2044]|nr:hypothetical protein F4778DRAFT_6488 [Xylariomycetidae sp. FL2044]